ncbi:DUF5691 domain-containing protein [Kitasatospora sp. NBC_01287]|uniref:DUF5691 domain-containing protein n=1 Tax=Kitasatospora sp. NBC_01287 TaxID=2903573 RepID=UPI0022509AA0|nr:DUF5691 domain-containing protein [Kitasatospora sp. NBC_01287]MCX4748560.1 DUF5691 domain-containing protein [Kitasatospora sp. NBC_01287]
MNDYWSELTTTALLGTDRRALPPPSGSPAAVAAATAVDRADPAVALLELAALATATHRAGLLPLPAVPPEEPPPADHRPELPAAAARRLTVLLAGRGGGAAANLTELLPQWLAAAHRHGYRPPAAQVPALLEAARARGELRGEVAALVGPLGRWLAERNPEWRYLLRTVNADAPTDEGLIWQEGLFAERVTHLTRLRRRDPAAALALLAGSWPSERAEDRLLFLDALQEGLGPADEPFLEAALGDRGRNVRATAAELLSALPGSALGRRMAGRALAAVRLGTTGALLVTPPAACDPGMRRDGIPLVSPTGRDERAWWLGEVLAATPLATWTAAFGLTPAQLLALPVLDAVDAAGTADSTADSTDAADLTGATEAPAAPGPWREELHEAWARAAVRQRDAAWARVLLGPPPRRAGAAGRAGAPAKLLAVLPPAERAAWTAAFLRVNGPGEAFQLLGACATPWTPPLSTAVVAALERAASAGSYPWNHSGVLGLTERSLAPATAPAVEALAADATPDTAWAETFGRLAGTLRFRAAMLAELAPEGLGETAC